ncbi:heterokaryon incompatibility protein-domain-containing protein [Lasiosphaeria ovina]|uniref:Heterokaryon incompatibility protein-domain-containing protein n=1 Tax=Lasiosphaeria ovina TaxID=92902 RepID=A0AAE0K6P5_9PEZI|nr:heterokaryon incompatibility protein-domain-containing protein [Lasiosphaeria ovina]
MPEAVAINCSCSDANKPRPPVTNCTPPPASKNDLCVQCASLDFAVNVLSGQRSGQQLRLRGSRASSCPLCRFLATVVCSKYPLVDPDDDIFVFFGTMRVKDVAFDQLFNRNSEGRKVLDKFYAIALTKALYDNGKQEFCILPAVKVLEDSGLPALGGRQIHPGSIDFNILNGWLDYCKNHHGETCGPFPGYPQRLPNLRVIDCETRAIVTAPEGCRFVALSYVWGSQGAKDAGRRSLLPDHVPRTIGDALQGTLRLGLRYLWVDQYCIDQSDEADLEQQISVMDMAYNLATVTIIAAAGDDASFGGFSNQFKAGFDYHIKVMTTRDLTFGKDVIKAMQGIFRAFSTMPSPIRHIWGIPVDRYDSENSCWPPNRSPLMQLPGKKDLFAEYYDSVFSRGLCWYTDQPSRRREGFPSWSWAGWTGALRDVYLWGFPSRFGDSEVKVWLLMEDGDCERLDEQVVSSANWQGALAIPYQPIVRIEAWTVRVRLRYIAGGLPDTKTHFQNNHHSPTYFVCAQIASRKPPSSYGTHY